MFTRESISKELKRISDSVPEALKKATLSEIPKTPAIEMVFKKVAEDESLPAEKREQARHLIESGMFSKKTIMENPKIAQMRDNWVVREIKKSVKAGRLPTKKRLKELGLDDYHDKN